MSDRVRARHSLVTRLLVTSVLIALAAIVATAWLATRTATRAISQEQGQSLADDKSVYDLLVSYAAGHPDWSQAAPLIDRRAAELGRRITVLTEDRVVIADSGPGPSLRTARPSAEVDPLDLDLGLTGGTERIDARVAGPFRVPAADRAVLRKIAADELTCLRRNDLDGELGDQPNGRPVVTLTSPDPYGVAARCHLQLAGTVSRTEAAALRSLSRATAACLGLQERAALLQIRPDFTVYLSKGPVLAVLGEEPTAVPYERPVVPGDGRTTSCVEKSRRALLQPYVAPPALLFVTDPGTGVDRTTFTLSGDNTVRIVSVTAAILLATILVTVLVGRRLVRPLRTLTDAVDGHRPVPVSGRDEIGRLARALNDSAARRDRAEDQRRAMVSDVAHELRTPLTNIRSWLEAAQDDLAATDAQLLTLLHEEAVLLQHVIDDLSDLAAADAGTLRLHPEQVALSDILHQVADSHRSTAFAAGVRLTVEVPGNPIHRGDPVRLRQLVGNLVSNAVRHTPPGGTVTVSASSAASAATITVRDTGVGIPAALLPRVFDRFWRADESRSRATGGSGLGLAIARQLTEAHGGTIEVASTPGEGTLFTIRLP